MSDPHESAGISVTIKQDEPGGKFNDAKSPGSWLVFHGSPAAVAEQIRETFGIAPSDVPLDELVQEATGLWKATSNVRQGLGAKVVGKPTGSTAEAAQDAAQAPASPKAEEKAEDPILFALKTATTLDEVKTVRAENQQAFTDNPDYLAAWKARGREIKAAV